MTVRNALLGACLALPVLTSVGNAQTTPPNGARMIYVPPGATVVILPGPGGVVAPDRMSSTVPDAMPMMRLIAEQQAAMQHMIADMNTLFSPMPDPNEMLRAAFGPGAPLNVSVMPLAGGHGVCSQSISIVARGDGSPPIVKASQSGDACGALGIGKPQGVDEVRPAGPVQPPHRPKLLEIGYPPHPMTTGTPPRT